MWILYYITLMFITPTLEFPVCDSFYSLVTEGFNGKIRYWGSINCYIASHGFYNCFISFCYWAWTLARTVLWWILSVNYLSTQLWPWMCLICRWCFEIWLPRLILWICCTALRSGPNFTSKVNTHLQVNTIQVSNWCLCLFLFYRHVRACFFSLHFSWNYNIL